MKENPKAPKPLPPLTPADITRFRSKVIVKGPDECWPWFDGNPCPFIYVKTDQGVRRLRASRIAYFLTYGEDPFPLFACHKCDNQGCSNGSHIFKGTHQDNMDDAVSKGRMASGENHGLHKHPERIARGDRSASRLHPDKVARGANHGLVKHPERHWSKLHPDAEYSKGEKNGRAKLTAIQAREIRSDKRPDTTIAKQYNVSPATVWFIKKGLTWKDA